MTKKKHRRYSPEFKRHTLKRASEDGVTDKGVDFADVDNPTINVRMLH